MSGRQQPTAAGAYEVIVSDPKVRSELRSFLWIDSFFSEAGPEGGWSCRDHTAVLGAMALMLDLTASVCHGKAMFIQGPSREGGQAYGLGQLPGQNHSHTWLEVEGLGQIDLSPNLSERNGWPGIDHSGVFKGIWQASTPVAVIECESEEQYAKECRSASTKVGTNSAVYLEADREPYFLGIADQAFEWANSPLTDRLIEEGLPRTCYLDLAVYLNKLGIGRWAQPDDGSRFERWRAVCTMVDKALE